MKTSMGQLQLKIATALDSLRVIGKQQYVRIQQPQQQDICPRCGKCPTCLDKRCNEPQCPS